VDNLVYSSLSGLSVEQMYRDEKKNYDIQCVILEARTGFDRVMECRLNLINQLFPNAGLKLLTEQPREYRVNYIGLAKESITWSEISKTSN